MTDRKTKPETCEECGSVFMTHSFHKRGKKGWLCSTECVVTRRLRLHGRDCGHCGIRYVEQSIRNRNGGFCTLECRNASLLKSRMKKCEHCKTEFDSNESTRFCCKECYTAFKRSKASKECMCCGKVTYKLCRRWVKEFCSITCSGKYRNYLNDRKARCSGCGKATGMIDSGKCKECRVEKRWMTAINEAIQNKKPHQGNPWIHKLNSLIRINEFREVTSRRSTVELRLGLNERKGSVWRWGCHWLDICSRLLKEEAKKQIACPWMKSIHNKMRSQRQRLERKALIANRRQRGD